MLTALILCWVVCAFVWVAALCAAAHTPRPRNTHKHSLAKLMVVHGRRFLS